MYIKSVMFWFGLFLPKIIDLPEKKKKCLGGNHLTISSSKVLLETFIMEAFSHHFTHETL